MLSPTDPDAIASSTVADAIRTWLPESFSRQTFLLEIWQWLALVMLICAGVVVDRLIRLIVGAWLHRLLARSEHLREKKHDADFERPVGMLAMGLTWWLLLPVLSLPTTPDAALTFAAQLVVAASGVWAAYRLVELLTAHLTALAARSESKIDDIVVPLASRAAKIVVIVFGLLFVAQNLDIDITSLLAGLGIGGLAFALAAKDTVENVFGSITVLIDRPFEIGDWVVIDDLEGTVETIGFRSTRIRTFYNSKITVPNSRLVNTSVDNLGARRFRRVKCMLSIQYDTPPDKIDAFCEGVRELIRLHPYTRKDYYMVYFNQFAGSSLDLLLYAFFETPDWPTELRERHRLFVDIVRLAQRLGVDFAFPTQTVHLASTPHGLMDAAPAPLPPAQEMAAPSSEEAVRLGRAEAAALARGLERQAPVDFSDPERISPRR